MSTHTKIASDIAQAIRTQKTVEPVLASISPADGTYLRRLLARQFEDSGDAVVGHKVGLTTAQTQSLYGVSAPGRGYLFNSSIVTDGAEVACGDLRVLIEPEIAVTMGSDVAPEDAHSPAALLASIAYAQVAIEVVATRWAPFPAGSIGAWMADDGMAYRAVLGPGRVALGAPELLVTTQIDSAKTTTQVTSGVLESLAWLVEDLASSNERLRSGMVVMTGALQNPVPVVTGSHVTVAVSGYGNVSARFT